MLRSLDGSFPCGDYSLLAINKGACTRILFEFFCLQDLHLVELASAVVIAGTGAGGICRADLRHCQAPAGALLES
ncbi:hypothetical protein [Pseudomonas chlororaphis]|uniref:hypothetical protein n=1 Tax=Pseudomonas chlororaphis TaxID=587753 RepID=UPI002407D775|nr:hypothetical protein [Pseudomonas chlororaphis]